MPKSAHSCEYRDLLGGHDSSGYNVAFFRTRLRAMTLAIFDLDNTLLGGDSDHAWGEFLIEKNLVDAAEHGARNDAFYHQYTEGKLDIDAYVKFTLGPILDYSLDELAILHREFMDSQVRPMILPMALDLIERHRAAGDRCLIMSATNAFITTPIATELGIQDILSTDLVVEDNKYTGAILGTPCFQEGKVTRLRQWLKLQNGQYSLDDSVFYSDSINDLPLLEVTKLAIAVDPDDVLRGEASKRNWQIISLR